MTTKELKKFFEEHLVPSRLYDIGGSRKNRICMKQSSDHGWDVFFNDNKTKVGLTHFSTESVACLGMKDEIRKLMEGIYGLTWKQMA